MQIGPIWPKLGSVSAALRIPNGSGDETAFHLGIDDHATSVQEKQRQSRSILLIGRARRAQRVD